MRFKHAFGELLEAMWIAMAKFEILIQKFLQQMTWISVPRTTFDFLLSPRTTLNSPQSFVLCKGEISNYYRALQACFSWAFGGDVDYDGEVLNSNPKVFGINDLNYRTQNDFRFAIVSAGDLEFAPILRTWQGWDIQLLQGSSSMLFVSFWKRCGLRWRSFEF